MLKTYNVGIIGATGMVGQRFITLLYNHPWFKITSLAASPRSANKTYQEAVGERWSMPISIPQSVKNMIVKDASDVDEISKSVDFVFCAVDMPKDDIKKLEEDYAKHECPVISNNSANRFTPDVPMIIPEVNPEHSKIIDLQRKRLGTKRGFIAVKSNCSLQSYVPAINTFLPLGVDKVLACTYQAISGAGKTFDTWPNMQDNVIPFIPGEEEKSEREPSKIWGHIDNDKIILDSTIKVTSQCVRVPISDGHTAAVFVSFKKPYGSIDNLIEMLQNYEGEPQKLNLPSAPKQFLHYFYEDDMPQIKLARELENGMAVSVGRLREDTQYDVKFICMSHNTLRGAAGGAVLMAELLCKQGYID